MISNIQKNIIAKAIEIRIKNGENLEEILNSYPRISDEDKDKIRKGGYIS